MMSEERKRVDNLRNRDLAAIHIAKAQLALDDETYRQMLYTIARVKSSADLDFAGRKRVLDHLRARGFKARPDRQQAASHQHPGRPANMDNPDRGPSLRKIEALLADAGRPWAYADGMARKMFHVEKIAWCEADQLHSIIGALMIDQKRRRDRAAKANADAL